MGRLTEDVVIGNDTLSRTLHPATERWAERVAAACEDEVILLRRMHFSHGVAAGDVIPLPNTGG